MFHEVAHGLGIKHTVDGKGTVRAALQGAGERARGGEGGHPRPLHGDRLLEQRRDPGATLEDHYVTFLASIFRSVRFGATEAHGRANAAQLHTSQEHGAFARDAPTGVTAWTSPGCAQAVDSLGGHILRCRATATTTP